MCVCAKEKKKKKGDRWNSIPEVNMNLHVMCLPGTYHEEYLVMICILRMYMYRRRRWRIDITWENDEEEEPDDDGKRSKKKKRLKKIKNLKDREGKF